MHPGYSLPMWFWGFLYFLFVLSKYIWLSPLGVKRIVWRRFDNCGAAGPVHFCFKGFSPDDDAHCWCHLLVLVEVGPAPTFAPKCIFAPFSFSPFLFCSDSWKYMLWPDLTSSSHIWLNIYWCALFGNIRLVFSIFIVECREVWRLSSRGSGIILFLFTSFQNPVQLKRRAFVSELCVKI